MVVSNVFSSLISLLLLIFVGYFLRKRQMIDEGVTKGFSTLLVSVCAPAMALYTLQQDFSVQRLRDLGTVFLGMLIVTVVGLVCGLVLCRAKNLPLKDTGGWINCVAFSNCVFMVRPILLPLYGEGANFPLSAVILTFNLIMFSLGILLANLGGPQSSGAGRLIRASLLNPAVISSILGLLLFVFSVRLPAPIIQTLSMLTNVTSPIAMIIIGSLLAGSSLRELIGDSRVYILTGLRLVVVPLITYFIIRPFIHSPILFNLIMLVACMPTGTTVAVFAEKYDNDSLLASKTVFISTLLSMITVPLFAILFH